MSADAEPLMINTLIEELQRAKAEGASWVTLQVNLQVKPRWNHKRICPQALPTFGWHDPNYVGLYVIGGDRIDWQRTGAPS